MAEQVKEGVKAEIPQTTEELKPTTVHEDVSKCEFPYGYRFERRRVLIRDILITGMPSAHSHPFFSDPFLLMFLLFISRG